MTQAFVGIGSNIDPERHVSDALDRLARAFGELRISPVYRSEAVGFVGAPFLNLVVAIETGRSLIDVLDRLREFERAGGYPGGAPKFSSRTLDLDLLLFGDACGTVAGVSLPREDICLHAYVLWPLADIAGTLLHPCRGISFRELRQGFTGSRQLAPVPFSWRGVDLSAAIATPFTG